MEIAHNSKIRPLYVPNYYLIQLPIWKQYILPLLKSCDFEFDGYWNLTGNDDKLAEFWLNYVPSDKKMVLFIIEVDSLVEPL